MPPNLQRFAYVLEFLVALIAVLMLWSQVGGQSHLDIMPWYFKLGMSTLAALLIVMATAASVRGESGLNGRAILWLGLLLLLMIGMGVVTYYYHLQEQETDDEGNDVAARTVFYRGPIS